MGVVYCVVICTSSLCIVDESLKHCVNWGWRLLNLRILLNPVNLITCYVVQVLKVDYMFFIAAITCPN